MNNRLMGKVALKAPDLCALVSCRLCATRPRETVRVWLSCDSAVLGDALSVWTTGVPVTTFKRSNRLYALAMSYNKGLDRGRDGIACESE